MEVLREFLLKSMQAISTRDPAAQRAFNERLAIATPATRATTRTAVDAGGVPSVWIEPRAGVSADALVMLYLHGGSYVYGSTRTHGDLMARFALRLPARVLGIEYRLAPEHPCPAQIEDAVTAWRWLRSTGVPAARMVIAGDSAGGALVVSTLVALRDAGEAMPLAALLLSPWVDVRLPGASARENERYDWGTRAVLDGWARWFAGDLPLDDPRVSPTFARLEGLPPTYVHIGGAEMLLDDAVVFASKLEAAGVATTLRQWEGMVHNFVMFEPHEPEAARAMEALVEYVRVTRAAAVGG